MKSKRGRPKISKEDARNVLIGARFTKAEAERLKAGIKKSKKSKSKWIRETLLAATEKGGKPKGKWVYPSGLNLDNPRA